MNLLKKFFGEGEIRNKKGEFKGMIQHYSENLAVIYDENGSISGTIETFGKDIKILDSKGSIRECGSYIGSGDDLDLYSSDTGGMRRYVDDGDVSVSSPNSCEYGSFYVSEDREENETDSDRFYW